jgi:cytochrome-b5 reductase
MNLFELVDFIQKAVVVAFVVIAITVAYFMLKPSKNDKKIKNKGKKTALDAKEYQPFKLVEIETISDDVKRFRFALQSSEHVLGLPIGQHISFKYTDEKNDDIIRSYTPTTSDDEIGYVDFVIKVYRKNIHPKFPDGKMGFLFSFLFVFCLSSFL